MIVINCPRCSESLRIPTTEVPDGAYAQCPWCHETFPASELLDRLPPVVQLMDGYGQPLTVSPAALAAGVEEPMANPFAHGFDGSAAPSADDGGEQDDDQYFDELKFGDEAADESTIDIQPGPAADLPEHRPMRVRAKEPGRKQKKSSIRTMLAIAVGPLLAIPLAGAILLLGNKLGFNDLPNLGFAPFDGSRNSTQQPRAAPPMDRGSSSAKSSRPRLAQANNPPGRSLLPENGEFADAVEEINAGQPQAEPDPRPSQITDLNSVPIRLPDALPPPPSKNPRDDISKQDVIEMLTGEGDTGPELPEGIALYPGDTQATSNPNEPGGDDTDDTQSPKLEIDPSSVVIADPTEAVIEPAPLELPAAAGETADDVAETTEPPPAVSPGRNVPELPPELSKPTDSAELIAAVKKAGESLTKLQQRRDEPEAKFKALLARTFVDLAVVGTQEADPTSESVNDLLSQIAQSNLLGDLEKAGPQWLNYKSRPNNGILLLGTADADKNTMTLASGIVVKVTLPGGVSLPDSGDVAVLGHITSSDDNPQVAVIAVKALPKQ